MYGLFWPDIAQILSCCLNHRNWPIIYNSCPSFVFVSIENSSKTSSVKSFNINTVFLRLIPAHSLNQTQNLKFRTTTLFVYVQACNETTLNQHREILDATIIKSMWRFWVAYPGCINHNFLWNLNYADLNCVIEKGQQDLLTLNSALSFKFRRTSLVALMWQCQKMTIQSPFFIKRILTDRPVYFEPSFLTWSQSGPKLWSPIET